MKYLKPDGNSTYLFEDNNKATLTERKKLKELDASYLELYGKHLVTNYRDI